MSVTTVSLGFQITLEMQSLFTISKILTYSFLFKKKILAFVIIAIHSFTLSQILCEFSVIITWKREREKKNKENDSAQDSSLENCPKFGDKREFVLKLLLSYKHISLRCSPPVQILLLMSLLICMMVLR